MSLEVRINIMPYVSTLLMRLARAGEIPKGRRRSQELHQETQQRRAPPTLRTLQASYHW